MKVENLNSYNTWAPYCRDDVSFFNLIFSRNLISSIKRVTSFTDPEADLRYVEPLCRREKFCSPTQLFDVPLDPPLHLYPKHNTQHSYNVLSFFDVITTSKLRRFLSVVSAENR